MDSKKIDKVTRKLLKMIGKAKLNAAEIITVFAKVGYSLGASIGNRLDDPPGFLELKMKYQEEPTVDVALMLQSLQMAEWVASITETEEK